MRRTTGGVSTIERYSTLLRILHGIDEDGLRHRQNPLVVGELKFVRPLLDVMAFDVGSLLFPVQHQPELEAGIRDCDTNTTLSSIVDGRRDVRVLVDVEYAPDLIELSP